MNNPRPKKKFILEAFGWTMVMILGQLIGGIVAVFYMAITNPNLLNETLNSDPMLFISKLSNFLLIGGVLSVLLVVLIKITAIKNEEKTWTQKCVDYLNLHPLGEFMEYVRYFCIGITINVVLSVILEFIYSLFNIESMTESMFDNGILMLLLVSFLVPISEEILYRNRIYIAFKNLNPRKANFFQALFFGIAHGNLIQGIYTFAFGYLFGKVNDNKHSLLPSICMHCGINFYAGMTLLSEGSQIYLIPFIIFAIPKLLEWIHNKKLT